MIKMNYLWHYNQLIKRGNHRNLYGYTEKHHIKPRCQRGDNSSENIVSLTPEEHFVAHQLLMKMYPKNIRLMWAVINMTTGNGKQKRNNKLYGWLRRRLKDELTGRVMSDEARRKMSENHNPNSNRKGQKHSTKTKKKMSIAAKGKPKSMVHREALSKARIGRKFGPHSEEHKRKIRESNKIAALSRDNSVYKNPDYKQSQSNKMKEIWRLRYLGEILMPKNVKFMNSIEGV